MIGALWSRTTVRLFAFALGVRLLFCVAVVLSGEPSAVLSPDSASYLAPARQLLADGTFSHGADPETNRAPGYPLFLAIGTVLGQPLGVSIALQILLSACTVVLVHRLCRLIFSDDRAALFAGVFAAIEPLSVVFTMKILSESLFGFIFVLSVILVITGLRRAAVKQVALGALMIGVSIYVRPIGKLVPLAIGLPLLLIAAWAAPARRRFLLSSVALVVSIPYVMMAPWIGRNATVAGYPGFVSQHDRDLFVWQGAAVTNLAAESVGEPRRVALGDETPFFERFPEARGFSRSAQLKLMGAEGRRIMMSHPMLFARVFIEGVALNLFAPGIGDLTRLLGVRLTEASSGANPVARWLNRARQSPTAVAIFVTLFVLNVLMWALALVGTVRPRMSRDEGVWLCAALLLYFPLVAGGPWGQGRLRMASMPLVAVLAGQGLLLSWQWMRRRRLPRAGSVGEGVQ